MGRLVMVRLSKFFIVGIAAIGAFGVKACGVVTVKSASSLSAGVIAVPKARLARAALVNEAGLFGDSSEGFDDEESAIEGSAVRVLPTESGASSGVSISGAVVNGQTYSNSQIPIRESDAVRNMRIAQDAEMQAYENMMRQQYQIQQMEAEQWRLQQQLQNAAGYPRNW